MYALTFFFFAFDKSDAYKVNVRLKPFHVNNGRDVQMHVNFLPYFERLIGNVGNVQYSDTSILKQAGITL